MAAEQATLITLFLMVLGCPLSFHKLDFGPEILWIGLWANFQMSAWRLPEEKYNRLRAILEFFRDTEKNIGQEGGRSRDRINPVDHTSVSTAPTLPVFLRQDLSEGGSHPTQLEP